MLAYKSKMLQVAEIDGAELIEKINKIERKLANIEEKVSPISEDRYIDRKEVAKIASVCVSTVINLERAGVLKSYRFGNKKRYKHSEVLEAMTPTQQPSKHV